MITLRLVYLDHAAALAAFAALGLTVEGARMPSEGASAPEIVVPSPGYVAGVRFDLLPVGGDGVLRRLLVAPEGAPEADPVVEIAPGWHADLLWHGSAEAVPDFGTAVVADVDGARVWLG